MDHSFVKGSTVIETAHSGQVTTVTVCMSCFRTGSPGKKDGTKATTPWKSSGRVKGRRCGSFHLPESSLLASILAERCARHQEGL